MRALKRSRERRSVPLIAALVLIGTAMIQPTAAARVATPPAGPPVDAQAAWQLRWAPSAKADGLGAFEAVEDDRADSHVPGQPHITVQDDNYRFTMHTVDRDTSTDRQRQEVRGMRAAGQDLMLLKGSTWRFTHSMYIPSSLKATTSFTHIMQTKMPGTGSLPMLTMSLQRPGGVPKIQLKVIQGDVVVGSTNLAPLQNRWIDMELEMTIGDAATGKVRWVLRNGTSTVVDVTRTRVDTWLGDRIRPKWGIYRSLGDSSGSLQNCYLLVANLRAYEWSATPVPPPARTYEAESAKVSRGVVESRYGGYRGTGYVNYDDVAGGYVEWTVDAAQAGAAVLNFPYANGTTINRKMDITVNGAVVADELAFNRTPAWDDWESRTVLTTLRAGTNTIRATATTANGGPNLDGVQVQSLLPAAAR